MPDIPNKRPEIAKISPHLRLDGEWRRNTAFNAVDNCVKMLNTVLDCRFPERVAFPNPHDLDITMKHYLEEFYKHTALLFDIARYWGRATEPTHSVYMAFQLLIESNSVRNVWSGHEPWSEWYVLHLGRERLYQLFDESRAKTVNPDKSREISELFARAHGLLHRLHKILTWDESPVTTSIIDIMPKVICDSPASIAEPAPAKNKTMAKDIKEKMIFQRPWLVATEGYGVYRYRLAKELGCTNKTLQNYERDGRTSKDTYWPTPLNRHDKHRQKFYDPADVVKALTALTADFSGKTPVKEILFKLMNNQLSSVIPPPQKKKPLDETNE